MLHVHGSLSILNQCRSVGLAAIFRTWSTSSPVQMIYINLPNQENETIGSPKVVGWGTLWGRHLVGFLLSGTQGKPPMELAWPKQKLAYVHVPSFIMGWSVCVCAAHRHFEYSCLKLFLNLDPLGMSFASRLPANPPNGKNHLPPAQSSPRFMHRIVPWRQVAWGQRRRWRLRSPWSRGHAACSWAPDDGLNTGSAWKHLRKESARLIWRLHPAKLLGMPLKFTRKTRKLHFPKGPTIQSPSNASLLGALVSVSQFPSILFGPWLLENLPKSS